MTPGIRPAGPDDLDAVRRIARAAYAPYVPRISREPAPMVADFAASIAAGELWVAGAPVAGFVVGYPRGDHWHLENVAVEPSAQGTGLGGALIAHVEAMARAARARAVELYTNADREPEPLPPARLCRDRQRGRGWIRPGVLPQGTELTRGHIRGHMRPGHMRVDSERPVMPPYFGAHAPDSHRHPALRIPERILPLGGDH